MLKKWPLPVAALAASTLFLAGCSSSEPSYCDEVAETQSTFDELVGTNIVEEGTDVLTERFDAFASQVDALTSAASDEFGDEAAAVESSVDQTRGVIEQVGQGSAAEAATQVQPALEGLTTSTQTLLDSVQNAC